MRNEKMDCIVCGRKGVGVHQSIHDGWCWWCVSNRMMGRGYDSFGKRFPTRLEDYLNAVGDYS